MFDHVLREESRRDLAALTALDCLRAFYLGGGTAIALHLGHRHSHDLDFFSQQPFAPDRLRDTLSASAALTIEQMSAGTLTGTFHRTKVGYFHYPYPLLKPAVVHAGVAVADLLDLACMKADAIQSRGTRRDFIDLYAICRAHIPLRQVLDAFAQKYRQVRFNRMHLLKSLMYFADAEQEPAPDMLQEITWDSVTAFFEREVPPLIPS